jgi:hypothetical protein
MGKFDHDIVIVVILSWLIRRFLLLDRPQSLHQRWVYYRDRFEADFRGVS